jgi:serine protease AprX
LIRWSKAVWAGPVIALALLVGGSTPADAKPARHKKMDKVLSERASKGGTSRVIIVLKPGWNDPSSDVKKLGGKLGRRLGLINGHVVELPNKLLARLADHPAIQSIHYDRPTAGEMNRAAVTIGARHAMLQYGYTGAGVGVAVIDSGITSWHDDLTDFGFNSSVKVVNGQRVARFVDFVNGRTSPYDDNGHGTHVSGIIAGNGLLSLGSRAGIAPQAHLVSLKVLDREGQGVISDVIAALDWTVANKAAYNLRVVNLSVGAAVTESYLTDPLTLAAKRAVDAGIVVVTAAGNMGKNPNGGPLYGGIVAPGNAPWVLTVGAFSHEGTVSRTDDVVASYSSRGPTAIDYAAKPDLVAPGTGMVSISDPTSLLYLTKPGLLLGGLLRSSSKPYLSLTGTSMAAPVVAGTVALMLEANPSLTPNMVKGILQYTAERSAKYDPLTQGGGFLNTHGAVQLARFFRTARAGQKLAMPKSWSKEVLWGNRRVKGGIIRPNANAWQKDTTWGSAFDADGDNIVWGTVFGHADNIVWGTFFGDADNIVWGTFDMLGEDNIVWGTLFDRGGDNIVWGTFFNKSDNIVWGTGFTGGDNIVWGTGFNGDGDNIVWGTDCGGWNCDNIVWGTRFDPNADNIVWGTFFNSDNIVWGTFFGEDNIVWGTGFNGGDNIVWGTLFGRSDNIVWGTLFRNGGDNIVWGTMWGLNGDVDNIVWGTFFGGDNIVWGTSGEDTPIYDDPMGEPVNFDAVPFEELFSGDALVDTTIAPVVEPITTVVEPVTTVIQPVTTVIQPVTSITTGLLGGLR